MNVPSDKIRRSDYDRFDEQVDPRVQVMFITFWKKKKNIGM